MEKAIVRVLVDTCIWSLVLRRQFKDLSVNETILREEMRELVCDSRAQLIGPIRQEILSGIRERANFERVREYLRDFADEPVATSDHELAAKLCNECRAAGVAGSAVDFLFCALAANRNWSIFTTDGDFKRYGEVFDLSLHRTRP